MCERARDAQCRIYDARSQTNLVISKPLLLGILKNKFYFLFSLEHGCYEVNYCNLMKDIIGSKYINSVSFWDTFPIFGLVDFFSGSAY